MSQEILEITGGVTGQGDSAVEGTAKINSNFTETYSHLNNTANPHGTTAAQVGADVVGTAASLITNHINELDPHIQYAKTTDILGLGETSTTAYRGDRGKVSYDHAQSQHAPSDAQKNSDITKSEVEAKLTGELTSHTHPRQLSVPEYGAISNSNNPSSGNIFITQADLVGGLPTGQIPNNFVNYDSDVSGLQTTASSSFVDITGMDLTITTSSAVPIVGYFTYTASKTGGGSDTTSSFRIARLDGANSPEHSLPMQVTINTGSSTENGNVTFRTTVSLVAGTYTFRPQFRRVSGSDTIQFVRGQFLVEAMQAPKGADAESGITSVGIANANGFNGSITNPTTTPVITVSTTVSGMVKGNGATLSAATTGTDYSAGTSALSTGIIKSTTGTGTLSIATAGVDYSIGTSALATGLVKSTTTTGALSTAVSGTDYSLGTSALATGIIKSTTSTGAFTIAVAGDFPTLNQSTTGSAATWTTGRTITLTGDVTGVSGALNGSANLSFAATLATAQPTAHTWALAQTFTTAPIFTNQSGTRTSLGLGSLAIQSVIGNISSTGAIGVTANLPLITTTSGVVTTGTFGTGVNTFCQGNDARLSDARTPLAHVHAAADITSGTFLDARIAASNVTQHQASLSIASTQVTGTKTSTFISDFAAAALTAAPAETLTTVGTLINGSASKATPVDADEVAIKNSVGGLLAKVTWANVKATLKTYFDTLYAAVTHTHTATDITSGVLNADRLATGTGLQAVRRNAGNTALEFFTITGGGDMYATNNLNDLANKNTALNNILPVKTTNALKVLRVNAGETDYELATISVGGGTVTSASVASANGFAGTVATATTTPAITISTTATGVLKGNGTAISAAVSGTDYSAGTAALATGIVKSTTTTGGLSIALAGDFPTLNQSTTGSAATWTTGRTITLTGNVTGVSGVFDGSGNLSFATTIPALTITDAMVATANKDGLAGTASMRTLGTGAQQATAGNDIRLSDARTPLSHVHGNITSAGAIGSTANLPIITTTSGVLTVGSFGTTANTFTQGNDSRLSDARTPTAHVHAATDITSGVLSADRLATGTGLQVLRRNTGNTALEFVTLSGGGDLVSTNNLSDVANVVTARNNLLPSKTANALKVLRVNAGETDYELTTIAGGGDVTKVGTPVDNQIGVWTGNGTIEGTSNLQWNDGTSTLTVGGTDPEIVLTGVTTEPTPAGADELKVYSKSVSGRMMLKMVGTSGIDVVLQPALFGNNICLWTPTTATAGIWQGTAGAGAGTFSTALPTVTNFYTSIKRARWANIVTTANQVLGQRNSENMFFRGSVAGQGGFFFFCRFGFDVWTAGGRLFIGMATATTVISANPSALNNTVGFCIDAGDTAISFLTRGTVATKTAIAGQPALANNQGYDAYIFCKPNDSTIYFRLDNLNTGVTIVNSSVTTNLPANTTMMSANALASNAANTVVTTTQIGVNRIYVETDR